MNTLRRFADTRTGKGLLLTSMAVTLGTTLAGCALPGKKAEGSIGCSEAAHKPVTTNVSALGFSALHEAIADAHSPVKPKVGQQEAIVSTYVNQDVVAANQYNHKIGPGFPDGVGHNVQVNMPQLCVEIDPSGTMYQVSGK